MACTKTEQILSEAKAFRDSTKMDYGKDMAQLYNVKSKGPEVKARIIKPQSFRRPLTEEKKQKLQKEGRCFFCEGTGHISRNCPKKKSSRPTARGANIEEEEPVDEESAIDSELENIVQEMSERT